jgi:hypothetical protein
MEDETLASTPSKEWPLDSLLKEGNKIIRNLSSSSPSRYASSEIFHPFLMMHAGVSSVETKSGYGLPNFEDFLPTNW